jgi:hypothetical protein
VEKIIGNVQTKPEIENGRIKFLLLREDTEQIVSCMSGAGFNCGPVEENKRISIEGEFKGSPFPFFFYSLEHLKDK